jgi:hypothetical protein
MLLASRKMRAYVARATLRGGKYMSSEKVSGVAPILGANRLKASRLKVTMDMLMENVDLDAINSEQLDSIIQNGYEAGEHFTYFIRTTGELIAERRILRTIKINRKKIFKPAQFMDHEGLEIEDQDKRSMVLRTIDSSVITLESMLKDETAITGEEHLKRLKQAGHTRLDARVFQTLWENQHLIPEYWKGTVNDPKHIFFDGTVLKNQYGRYVISMYWDVDDKWKWTYCRLDIGSWKAEDLSAVIKSAGPMRRVERRNRKLVR